MMTSDGLPFPRRWIAIAAITCGNVIVMVDSVIANVALPTIARSLKVDDASVILIITIYQLILLACVLPLSALGDRIGQRRMFIAGQSLFAFATLLCLSADDLPTLMAIRALQALGAAASLAVSTALLRDVYPAAQLGRGLGFNTLAITMALTSAPILGGAIISNADWTWLFVAELPLAALALLLAWWLPVRPRSSAPFDTVGAIWCAASLCLVGGGIDSLMHAGVQMLSLTAIAAGLVLGTLFLRRERHEERPIFPVDLLRNPGISLSAVAAIAAYAASMVLILAMPFRLTGALHLSPAAIGRVLTGWPIGMMLLSPVAGILSDRFSPRQVGLSGAMLAVASLTFVAMTSQDASALMVAWQLGLCGAAFGLFFAPNARLIIGETPRERTASAGGLISTARLSGQLLGASITAALLRMGATDGHVAGYVAAGLASVTLLCGIARLFMLNDRSAVA
ncbi:MAG: MFS transporter [Sphingobium sp.]